MNQERNLEEVQELVLTNQERKIVETIRNLEYGEVRVVIVDRKPTRIEERKNTKL